MNGKTTPTGSNSAQPIPPTEPPVIPNPLPTMEQVSLALRYVYDTLDASILLNHYSLIGQTAKMVKDKDTQPGTVEVAIFDSRLTREVRANLILWGFGETQQKDYFGTVGVVPVLFRRVQPTPYVLNPDTVPFDVDFYRVPNPFEEYWQISYGTVPTQ